MNWTGVIGSSRAVQMSRAAMAGSVVVNARRQLAVRLPILCRDVQAPPASVDDDRAIVVLENSAIVQVALRCLGRIDRACHHSGTARITSALFDKLTALGLWQRVRLTALMLLSAVVVHLALTRFSAPEPTLVARVTWIVIGTLLVAVIAGARAVAAAWVDWSKRRPAENEGECA